MWSARTRLVGKLWNTILLKLHHFKIVCKKSKAAAVEPEKVEEENSDSNAIEARRLQTVKRSHFIMAISVKEVGRHSFSGMYFLLIRTYYFLLISFFAGTSLAFTRQESGWYGLKDILVRNLNKIKLIVVSVNGTAPEHRHRSIQWIKENSLCRMGTGPTIISFENESQSSSSLGHDGNEFFKNVMKEQ